MVENEEGFLRESRRDWEKLGGGAVGGMGGMAEKLGGGGSSGSSESFGSNGRG